jgi:hypothetical protein
MSSVVRSDHFADGWQNKKASEKVAEHIRDDGQKSRMRDSEIANKTLDALKNSNTNEARDSSRPNNANAPASQPPRTSTTRQETQQEGARLTSQEQAFERAKNDANRLGNLARSNPAQMQSRTSTSDAVVSRNPSTQPNLTPDPQTPRHQSTFTLSQAMNRVPHQPNAQQTNYQAAAKTVDPNNASREQGRAQRSDRADEQPNAQKAPNQGQAATAQGVAQTAGTAQSGLTPGQEGGGRSTVKREGDGEKIKEKKNSSSSSKSSGVYQSRATRDLEQILEGGVSSNTGGGSDAEAEVSENPPVLLKEIPEEDTTLTIFNEYDTSNPGIETVLAKRNILERHVIKRLTEIEALNVMVETRINDVYATTALKDRIIGDLKDELDSAKFHKSVYGGLIG